MKVGLNGTAILALAALAALGVVGVVLWNNREWFTITSDKNLASRGASAFVAGVTGGAAAGGEDSVGGVAARFREWVSGDGAAIEAMKAGTSSRGAKDVLLPTPYDQGYIL